MGDITVYLQGLKCYCTRPPLFHGVFFVYLCHNAVPKPHAVAYLSSIRNFEIRENQGKRGHEGFLKFQKSFVAFRWPEKYSPISTKCVEFFQDPVEALNVPPVMAEPYRTLHICKAGSLAGFAQCYFAFVDGNSILADYASLLVWLFFLACNMLELDLAKMVREVCQLFQDHLCSTSCCNHSLFCWLRSCAVGFPTSSGPFVIACF